MTQALRVRTQAPTELRVAGRELIEQPARQRGNRLALERGDLARQVLHGRVLVGVTVLQGAKIRPLRGQLGKRGGEVRVRLDGPDYRKLVGGDAGGVADLRQQTLQRLAILLDPLPIELHVEEAPKLWIQLGALGASAGPARRAQRHGRRPVAR